ncbi:Rhodanese-like protein [Lojkania enalia]|uniref:Rhodanese-like protein n=1 Tax=Lojkania enalia TaxID=147567 RepID=A0A9P4K2P5_9PLEO|nr:Rhodanese-like protein [Didymosphaeria enalia]
MDAYLRYTYQSTPRKPASTTAMSNITLADLSYVTRDELAKQIAESPSGALPDNVAVIDVRDSDRIGGHIKGSTWVPSSELDYRVPELVRTLKGKDTVVFHCALSQQRGPSAALKYLREKRRLDPQLKMEGKGEVKEDGDGEKVGEEQKVVVLDGGFVKWQEKFGESRVLTEGYQKDIWEFGY